MGILILILTASCGCRSNIKTEPIETIPKETIPVKPVEKEQYLKIVTTNKFLYHMVKDIVKDRHKVDYILKNESDQWNYEYTLDSLENISKKDLFIYCGANYEPWVPAFAEEVKKGRVGIINVSRGIRILSFSKPRKYKTIENKENPYYWLNPDDYKVALSNVKNSIQERDPKDREIYENNFSEAIKSIDKYIKDMKLLNDNLKKYNFVVIGDNLDYFTKGFNIKAIKLEDTDTLVNDDEKINKKIGDLKDIVLLYDNEKTLDKYSNITKKYNIKLVRIIIYNFDMDIYEVMKLNYEGLNSLLNQYNFN